MRLRKNDRGHARQPDLTGLINIVFLILIFFIVAGTLRPFWAQDLELAKIDQDSAASGAPRQVIAHANGRLSYAGQDIQLEALAQLVTAGANRTANKTNAAFTIVADGRLPGRDLLKISRTLRIAGIENISVLVEREQK